MRVLQIASMFMHIYFFKSNVARGDRKIDLDIIRAFNISILEMSDSETSEKKEKKGMSKKEKKETLEKKVFNYGSTEIKPDFGIEPFLPYKKKLEALYTDRKRYVVSFDLIGVSDKIANAIRRTIMGELPIKALTFDPVMVQTNAEFIIIDELLDRIQCLPLRQDVPDGTTLSVSAVNRGQDVDVLYSSSLNSEYVSKRFRLAELRPGNYLRIPEIKVVTGFGRDHSMFSLSNKYHYSNLDYMDVHVVNAKGNRLTKRILVQELFGLISPKSSVCSLEDKIALHRKRVLVIPNKDYRSLIDADEQAKIDVAKYDHVIVNTTDSADFLQERSSFVSSSTEFRMSFHLTGQIEPMLLLPMTCDNLRERLLHIKNDILGISTDEGSFGIVRIRVKPATFQHGEESVSVPMFELLVTDETHTIGEMLVTAIYERDPDIAFVRKRMDHPKDTRVYIDIIHPEARKILLDSIDDCISVFEKIKEESS